MPLDQQRRLHHLALHVGTAELDAYDTKYREIETTWQRIFPPGKTPTKPPEGDREKAERLAWSGEGRDSKIPENERTDFHHFQRRWQFGRATLPELVQQIETLNDILHARNEQKIERLAVRPVPAKLAAHAEDVEDLRRELASSRAEVAELRRAVAELERFVKDGPPSVRAQQPPQQPPAARPNGAEDPPAQQQRPQ
jgi:hypothetical protein